MSRCFRILRLRASRTAQDDRFGRLEELSKAIADLGDGIAQSKETVKQDGTCEVEGVAGGVEVAIQNGGLLASQG
jgi:hypothetical protein